MNRLPSTFQHSLTAELTHRFTAAIGRTLLLLAATVLVATPLRADNASEMPSRFTASALRVEDFHGDLTIDVFDESASDHLIAVEPREGADKHNWSAVLDDGVLVIRGFPRKRIENVTVITNDGDGQSNVAQITIGNESIRVEGDSAVVVATATNVAVPLRVAVSAGTRVELVRFRGNAHIADTVGPLFLDLSGSVTGGRVRDATIRASASGKIRLRAVTERLDLRLRGNSRVVVESGHVEELTATLKGNARASFGGDARTAFINARGNARLSVHRVIERPQVQVAQNARVRIGNR